MHATPACEDISEFDRPAVPVYGRKAMIGRSKFRGRVKQTVGSKSLHGGTLLTERYRFLTEGNIRSSLLWPRLRVCVIACPCV